MGHARAVLKKSLDKGYWRPYPTPSMSSSLSPEMLTRGSSVHAWTERGDLTNAGEEEGCQEGRLEEEEVGAPGTMGGWTDHPLHHFHPDLASGTRF